MTTKVSPESLLLRESYREAMASVCTPVSVVTTLNNSGAPHGTTVSAFTALSMEPPMVLVSLDKRSGLLALLHPGDTFGLNILGSSQSDLALRFAVKGPDKFDGVSWTVDAGAPRIDDSGAFVSCTVSQIVEGGDHQIVLGLVNHADAVAAQPLTYHARQFGTHTSITLLERLAKQTTS